VLDTNIGGKGEGEGHTVPKLFLILTKKNSKLTTVPFLVPSNPIKASGNSVASARLRLVERSLAAKNNRTTWDRNRRLDG
jgi:hypothetical protein